MQVGVLGMKERSVGGEGVVGLANLAVVECLHMLMIQFYGSWDMCRENNAKHEAASSLYKSRCCNLDLGYSSRYRYKLYKTKN